MFNRHGRKLIFSILSAPFWLQIKSHDDDGNPLDDEPYLFGEAVWPNGGAEPIHRYGIDRISGQTDDPVPIKIRAVDEQYGFAAVKTFDTNGLAVSKPDSQVTMAPTLRLEDHNRHRRDSKMGVSRKSSKI